MVAGKFALAFLKLKQRPNIIHGHDPYGEGLAAVLVGKVLHVPVVITWHAAELVETTAAFSLLGNICRSFVLRNANRVIVNSDLFKRLALSSINVSSLSSKTRIISPGVDVEEFNTKDQNSKLQDAITVKKDFTVLSVCRLEKIKGLDTLLEAAPKVLKAVPNVKFILVGSGSERKHLESLCQKKGIHEQVIFVGNTPRSALPQYYSLCDLFVLPTRGEGFGMAYLEAWACGKPIVTTPYAPEIAKLVDTYGGGIVVNDNPDILADEIVGLLQNQSLRVTMGLVGRGVAAEHYSWKKTASEHLEVYRELCRTPVGGLN